MRCDARGRLAEAGVTAAGAARKCKKMRARLTAVSAGILLLSTRAASGGAPSLPLQVRLQPSGGAPFSMALGVDRGPGCDSGAFITQQLHDARATHIRTHDSGVLDWCVLFPNPLADTEDPLNYRWAAGDAYFAQITGGGFVPYVRLGTSWSVPSPACLQPDPAVFARVAVATVRHFTEGWGGGTVYPNAIFWEVWNEPDGPRFWNATPGAFYELYDAAARALKAHNASLIVGGPGVASALRDTNYSFGLIDHVAASGAPLDFFSFHGYGTHAARPTALFAPMAAALCARLDGAGLRAAALHVTEWAPAILANQSELDSAAYAAFVATALTTMEAGGVAVAVYYPGCEGVGAGSWGLFQDGGGGAPAAWRRAGRAYQAVGATLRDTPLPYAAQVAGGGEASALAGRTPGASPLINAVVSAVSGATSGAALTVGGLPPGAAASVSAWCLGGGGGGGADPPPACVANASAAVGADGVLVLPLLPLEVPGVVWVQAQLSR